MMSGVRTYRTFRIRIRPSPETNDHEVRFIGDEDDVIEEYWPDMMGLDPDEILVRPCPLLPANGPQRALVARCNCGVVGCGSVEVEVSQTSDYVDWTSGESQARQTLRFPAVEYEVEVELALTDTSWETPDRTAARLLREQVNRAILLHQGLTFRWASGRIRENAFSVALNLEPGPYQVLVHLPWNPELMPPEQIAKNFAKILMEPPQSWEHVEYFPQAQGLGPPSIAGPSWRRRR